jgi:hypothetical protein
VGRQQQALRGASRGQARDHVVLRLGADPAEDGELKLELREQERGQEECRRERGFVAPRAHQAEVEQSPAEGDHPRQSQRVRRRGKGHQRRLEARAFEDVVEERRGAMQGRASVLARQLREAREQLVPSRHGSHCRSPTQVVA